jgi:hypothetical protein
MEWPIHYVYIIITCVILILISMGLLCWYFYDEIAKAYGDLSDQVSEVIGDDKKEPKRRRRANRSKKRKSRSRSRRSRSRSLAPNRRNKSSTKREAEENQDTNDH